MRGAVHARGQAAGRRGHLPLPGDVGRPRAVRRGWGRAVLPRRDRPSAVCDWVRERRRDAGHGRHGRVRADRAAAGEARFRGYDGAHQPAAVLGRDPDRLLARSARAPRRAQRRGGDRRGHGGRERAAHRRLPRGTARRGLRAAIPGHGPRRGRGPDPRPATGSAGHGGAGGPRSGPGSARPPTSPCSTPTATARRSPARTGPAPASSSPTPGCTSTTCWERRTSTRRASTGSRPAGG